MKKHKHKFMPDNFETVEAIASRIDVRLSEKELMRVAMDHAFEDVMGRKFVDSSAHDFQLLWDAWAYTTFNHFEVP